MEKEASPPANPAAVTIPTSPPPSLSPVSHRSHHKHQEEFAASFASLYQSVFAPESQFPVSLSLSPSPRSSSASSPSSTDVTTEHRLHQARLVLEYSELCDHYELCLSRLQSLTAELESLRSENAELQLANAELMELIHISSSQSVVKSRPNDREVLNFGPRRAVLQSGRFDRRNDDERVLLPKSISVRSRNYLKLSHQQAQAASGPSPQTSPHAAARQRGSSSRSVYLPAREKEGEELELEVYAQGTVKTELCNKWQETGTCPYGEHCQFAHGINELRPVIRHPRYKTQVCRMVLAGITCPYGHRCHFRHSLTEQERLTGPH